MKIESYEDVLNNGEQFRFETIVRRIKRRSAVSIRVAKGEKQLQENLHYSLLEMNLKQLKRAI